MMPPDRAVEDLQVDADVHEAVELLARDDAARVARERDEEVQLAHREDDGAAAGEDEALVRADLQLADPDKLAVTRLHRGRRLCAGGAARVIRS